MFGTCCSGDRCNNGVVLDGDDLGLVLSAGSMFRVVGLSPTRGRR
jgi:hypothetical protein